MNRFQHRFVRMASGAGLCVPVCALILGVIVPLDPSARAAGPVTVTVLHTNDLHSHFRSEKTPLAMGGIARLKTAIDAERRVNPRALLVDGGDWSEGTIYYTEGAGAESLRLMDHLGYDVTVVGNHDWLNGPNRLLDAVSSASPRLSLLGANLEVGSGFARAAEFRAQVPPYVIKEVSGARIAFIGIANHDPYYAAYLAPVKTTEPGPAAAKLATRLKSDPLNPVDAVVVISHNAIDANRQLLQAALDVDLVIGAHDHQKLLRPVLVPRPGRRDGWIVEAGSWGRYLGHVELVIQPREPGGAKPYLELAHYQLTQIDRGVPEDPGTLSRLDALEARIAARRGNVFHDHVADCEVDLHSQGIETPIGDFATDAYRRATGADIGVEQNKFIYGMLHAGSVDTADFFEANPPIYDVAKDRTWTVHTWTMRGSDLQTLFGLVYSWRKVTDMGGLSLSGLEITYDPSAQKEKLGFLDFMRGYFGIGSAGAVKDLAAEGRPIDPAREYKLAASAGIVEVLRQINAQYFNIAPMRNLRDTGVEGWAAMRDHARALARIHPGSVRVGGRIRTSQPDLGIDSAGFGWTPLWALPSGAVVARVEVTVRNFGASASPAGASIGISTNLAGVSGTVEPDWRSGGQPQEIPALAPGESRVFAWDRVEIPASLGIYPLMAAIQPVSSSETHTANDYFTRYFMP